MSHTVLVWCEWCVGGLTADYRLCGHCKGQEHYAVNRMPDGTCPPTHKEWHPPMLPELPPPKVP